VTLLLGLIDLLNPSLLLHQSPGSLHGIAKGGDLLRPFWLKWSQERRPGGLRF